MGETETHIRLIQVTNLNQYNAPVKETLRTNGFSVDLYQKLKEYQLSV